VIPDSFKQDLLNRVDIVDVVNARVPLKKAGANWTACCPFHSEKSPSFTVSPSKQFYHCFGCGAHGNAIGFLMEYAGLGYIDALRELAEGVGMKLPEMERSRDARPEEGPDLYDFMARAAKFYREQLKAAPGAIEYLKGRGLTGQTAAKFGIGYAPDDWQALQAAFPEYGGKEMVDCGLVIVNEQGRRYDRFRDRVMFPILNQRGFVVGFGGRVIGDGEPKYLNSPETPLFEKGRELYGLPQARIPIREKGRVIVVEGYMDVVMLAQHGVGNAVATLGTATTPAHVQKLLRVTDEIVFCFDGDAAGRRAAWHALEVSLESLQDRKAVRFLFLPPEHDPDSFVREHGAAVFEERLARAEPLSAYLLRGLQERFDTATIEGRARLASEAKPLLAKITAPALRTLLFRAVSDAVGISPRESTRVLGAIAAEPKEEARGQPRPSLRQAPSLPRALAHELLAAPGLAEELPQLPAVQGYEALAALARHCLELRDLVVGGIMERGRGTPFEAFFAQAVADFLLFGLSAEEAAEEFRQGASRLAVVALREELQELEKKAKAAPLSDGERARYAALIRAHAALRHALGTPS
jgi:DNA primase